MFDDVLFVSVIDVIWYFVCCYFICFDLVVVCGELFVFEQGIDEMFEYFFQYGIEYEQRYLQALCDRGLSVVEIVIFDSSPFVLWVVEVASEYAMVFGVDVVYQVTFFDGCFCGYADFLLRCERFGWWLWFYDVVDIKLVWWMKVPVLLQMVIYVDWFMILQGVVLEQLIVVIGDCEECIFLFVDCVDYVVWVCAVLFMFFDIDDDLLLRLVLYCHQCWWELCCCVEWRCDDDLLFVVFLLSAHVSQLCDAGIAIVWVLVERSFDELLLSIGVLVRECFIVQACLQVVECDIGRPFYDVLLFEFGCGFALLFEPFGGDVFFDIEGDLFFGDYGLEYLFGLVLGDEFIVYWVIDFVVEKYTFEQLVDYLIVVWDVDLIMYVYYYVLYELFWFKVLFGCYVIRGVEVDWLLRG